MTRNVTSHAIEFTTELMRFRHPASNFVGRIRKESSTRSDGLVVVVVVVVVVATVAMVVAVAVVMVGVAAPPNGDETTTCCAFPLGSPADVAAAAWFVAAIALLQELEDASATWGS